MAGEEFRNSEDVASEETELEIPHASEKHTDELIGVFTVKYFYKQRSTFHIRMLHVKF